MSAERHVVVIGGGIAGLSAAYHLVRNDARPPAVTLLEAGAQLGGKIRTIPLGGQRLDMGPEALLTRQPAALTLCRELGLGDELVAPVADQAFVWLDELRPLPPRLLAGAPDGAATVIRTGTLSSRGIARAGLDFVLPRTRIGADMSIGELVRRRLGDEVLERLIDPLLGGIHAGRCDELSVRATAPQLELALRDHRSLTRGLRALAARAPHAPGSPFLTLRGGLATLVDALVARMESGVDISVGAAVRAIEPLPGGAVRVVLATGETLDADDVIVAAPAFAAAPMLDRAAPAAAAELRAVDYASVATVAFTFTPGTVSLPPHASGLLVPPTRRRTITASTWSSAKWAHLAGGPVIVKCSVGGDGHGRDVVLDDEELTGRVRDDLRRAVGIEAVPEESAIVRFRQALPQYRVGHIERVARIDAALADLPGVHLAGAAYRGVGVAACVRDGALAAERVAARGGRPATISSTSIQRSNP